MIVIAIIIINDSDIDISHWFGLPVRILVLNHQGIESTSQPARASARGGLETGFMTTENLCKTKFARFSHVGQTIDLMLHSVQLLCANGMCLCHDKYVYVWPGRDSCRFQ